MGAVAYVLQVGEGEASLSFRAIPPLAACVVPCVAGVLTNHGRGRARPPGLKARGLLP
jgi:hypothetical protein